MSTEITAVSTQSVSPELYQLSTASVQSVSSVGTDSNVSTVSSGATASVVVSDMMNAEVVALNQGVQNANDAISLSQTAEGSIQVINEQLIRMQELAMQSSGGIYSAAQRAIIDAEYQMMAQEITRIANMTEFNGMKLLDGSLSGEYDGSNLTSKGEIKIHFGPMNDEEEDYYKLSIGSLTAESLEVGADAGNTLLTQESSAMSFDSITNALTTTTNTMAHIGSFQNRLESTVSALEIQSENLFSTSSRIKEEEEEERIKKFIQEQAVTNPAQLMFSQANRVGNLALQYMN